MDEKAAKKHLGPEARTVLEGAREALATITPWEPGAIHLAVQGLADTRGLGLGKVAQPIRVAVSGGSVSPPIDQTLSILGREKTLRRLDAAIAGLAG